MKTLLAAILALSALAALVQEPQFEVASIKPSPERRPQMFAIQPGGRLSASGVTARVLIQRAFGLQPHQIDKLPQWAIQERFELQAKPTDRERPYGSAEVLAMLQGLLSERFGLQHHRETQVRPVFFLSREREDRPLSSSFRASAADCAGRRPEDVGPVSSADCGVSTRSSDVGVAFSFHGRALAQFANDLVVQAGRPVLDRTNIDGQFDIEVVVERGGALVTAIREQLGLRLVSADAPIEMLVVDAIHPPTPD